MNVKEALTKTKEVLVNRGRSQGSLVSTHIPGRPCCLIGAVGFAVYGEDWIANYPDLGEGTPAWPVVKALARSLPNTYGDDEIDKIWKYNDRIIWDQTVLDQIDEAIEAYYG